jgi:hypothetical protein
MSNNPEQLDKVPKLIHNMNKIKLILSFTIIFFASIGLFILKNSTQQNVDQWKGVWIRSNQSQGDSSILNIFSVQKNNFEFDLLASHELVEGDFTYNEEDREPVASLGDISKRVFETAPKAYFLGNKARYFSSPSDDGIQCYLEFNIEQDILNIKESDCLDFKGVGVSFEGDYVKNK